MQGSSDTCARWEGRAIPKEVAWRVSDINDKRLKKCKDRQKELQDQLEQCQAEAFEDETIKESVNSMSDNIKTCMKWPFTCVPTLTNACNSVSLVPPGGLDFMGVHVDQTELMDTDEVMAEPMDIDGKLFYPNINQNLKNLKTQICGCVEKLKDSILKTMTTSNDLSVKIVNSVDTFAVSNDANLVTISETLENEAVTLSDALQMQATINSNLKSLINIINASNNNNYNFLKEICNSNASISSWQSQINSSINNQNPFFNSIIKSFEQSLVLQNNILQQLEQTIDFDPIVDVLKLINDASESIQSWQPKINQSIADNGSDLNNILTTLKLSKEVQMNIYQQLSEAVNPNPLLQSINDQIIKLNADTSSKLNTINFWVQAQQELLPSYELYQTVLLQEAEKEPTTERVKRYELDGKQGFYIEGSPYWYQFLDQNKKYYVFGETVKTTVTYYRFFRDYNQYLASKQTSINGVGYVQYNNYYDIYVDGTLYSNKLVELEFLKFDGPGYTQQVRDRALRFSRDRPTSVSYIFSDFIPLNTPTKYQYTDALQPWDQKWSYPTIIVTLPSN